MPKQISIIVPVYNAAPYLERCVRSILNQDFADFELLLVDDGSDDDSLELMYRLAQVDSRIVVLHRDHAGVSVARNYALDKAVGQYVCFVDADDYVAPSYLSSLYAHKDCDMVVSGYVVDEETCDGNCLRASVQSLPQSGRIRISSGCDPIYPLFKDGRMHACWNKMMKNDIIRKHAIRFPSICINEDYIFVVNYLVYAKEVYAEQSANYHWVRVNGRSSGVDSLPSNLLEIYLDACEYTKKIFRMHELVDKFFYFSYEFVARKYMTARRQGVISSKHCRKLLHEMFAAPAVLNSFRLHHPKSLGAAIQHYLLRFKLFSIYEKVFL